MVPAMVEGGRSGPRGADVINVPNQLNLREGVYLNPLGFKSESRDQRWEKSEIQSMRMI